MSYDADTTRTYVENGGGYCPECDHEDVNSSRPYMIDTNDVRIDYSCPRCKAQWHSYYLLDDVRPDKHGDYHNQQQLFERTG